MKPKCYYRHRGDLDDGNDDFLREVIGPADGTGVIASSSISRTPASSRRL